jgi:hypothetical protein
MANCARCLPPRHGSVAAANAAQVLDVLVGDANVGQQVCGGMGKLTIGGAALALLAPGIENLKHDDLLVMAIA